MAGQVNSEQQRTFFGRSDAFVSATVTGLFLLGAVIRLLDLTEPPLDYQPTRQLRGALIARSIYLQWSPPADPAMRDLAVDLARSEPEYEPAILESVVALSYLIAGEERLWFARVWSIAFWIVGGWFVYKLAGRLSSVDGAVAALGYFLLLPLGISASRSFQPDSLMVMLLVASAYCLFRWSENPTWRWALIGGLLAGLSVLVKGRPAPIVGGMLAGVILAQGNLKSTLRQLQPWAMLAVSAVIPAVYYVGVTGRGTLGLLSAYSAGLANLLTQPSFYVRWLVFLDRLVYLGVALPGLAAIAFMPRTGRGLMLGLWSGYLLYGLALPYTIYTHDYYSLPFVAVVALSLAPIAALIFGRMSRLAPLWQLFALGTVVFGVAYWAWVARSGILGTDFYDEPAGWVKMGRELPKGGSIIGLTHDYGARIAYYGWRRVEVWPGVRDFAFYDLQGHNREPEFDLEFEQRTRGYDYFLVTLFGELDQQPDLKRKLFEDYSVFKEGDGYILFDLTPND